MDITQTIICLVSCFLLGAASSIFILWLFLFGIPNWKMKRWNKFEEDVVYVVKKNFDRPMIINKEFIKGIVEEVLHDKH